MRTTILSLITLLLFITSSPVYAGTIFEWREFNTNSEEWEKPTDKSLIIEFEDTKVVGGSKLVGIENNIISITFDYFSVGDGFILDIDDLQDPNDLIIKFNSDGDEIEFLQLVGHETSQATIWIGGFSLSYEGVMRFRGNLNSQPFNYAINGRRDNKPTSTTWDFSEVEGRFMKAAEPENQPPAADAGENIDISSEQITTTIIQGTATDGDENDTLEYRWIEGETVLLDWASVGENGECPLDLSTIQIDIGAHTLTLEVTDGQDTSSDEVILTIDNSAPEAVPTGGGTYQIGDPINLGGQVLDFDGDWLSYEWLVGDEVQFDGQVEALYGGDPVALPEHELWGLDVGQHKVTLRVSDDVNEPVSSDISVEVVDTIVPTLAPTSDKSILWPANHKMVDIAIVANAEDNSGGPVSLLVTVSSNEPEDGTGDGNTASDWEVVDIDDDSGIITLTLRAESSGSGDGRIYTITITATDEVGNSSTSDVEIIVPHDKRGKKK